MKTAEITRHKTAATGVKPPSTMAVFMDIYRREGIVGINKGVNAVAIRQCTNWGSRSVHFLLWCRIRGELAPAFATFASSSSSSSEPRSLALIAVN